MSDAKSAPYVVVIDEKRQEVLSAMFNLAYIEKGDFIPYLVTHSLFDVFVKLLEECTEAEHERGWCKDESCTDNK